MAYLFVACIAFSITILEGRDFVHWCLPYTYYNARPTVGA